MQSTQVAGEQTIRRFRLSDAFIEDYMTKEIPWGYGDLSFATYKRTYSRNRDELDPTMTGNEEWYETCRRVIEGMFTIQKRHCVSNGLPWDSIKAQRTAKDAYDRLFTLKWTPPGRGLWMMGTPYVEERTGAGLFNCAFVSTDDIAEKFEKPFCWAMDALMLGVGVGFDTDGAGKLVIQEPESEGLVTLVVPDDREGWVHGLGTVLRAFLCGEHLPGYDLSKLRKKGSRIKGFGGTASGPEPLRALYEKVTEILRRHIGMELTSEIITDIFNLIGKCVVAGNVRRSAQIALGAPDDTRFMQLKDWRLNLERMGDDGWGWSSNNTIKAIVGMDYTKPAEFTKLNGEPGYAWIENARRFGRFKDGVRLDDTKVKGFNPCVEQQLESYELCCLVETYMARHDSFEDYLKTLKIAYMYAKTVTLVSTHWPETNAIMLKNRRIGLSQTGVVQAMNKWSRRTVFQWCDQAYNYLQKMDSQYSDWLCVPRSKRMTSIKPSGTVSLLAGATPGIHFPHHEYYIRRVRYASNDPIVVKLKAAGYKTEPCTYADESTVVEFPVHEPYFKRGKKDVTMWEQLEMAAQFQYWWADNSVSVTVNFTDEEAKDIPRALEMYETRLKAVSFLPTEHGYKQAPYEEITEAEFKKRTKNLKSADLSDVQATGDKYFCDGEKCELPVAIKS